jgi:hypothetical protein
MPVRARRGARTVDDRVATCLAPRKRGARGGGAPPQRRAPSPGRSTCRATLGTLEPFLARARVTRLCAPWPLCASCGRARRRERGGTGGGGFCQALQVWSRGQGSSWVRVWVQASVLGFGFGFRVRFWGSGLGSGFGFGVRVWVQGSVLGFGFGFRGSVLGFGFGFSARARGSRATPGARLRSEGLRVARRTHSCMSGESESLDRSTTRSVAGGCCIPGRGGGQRRRRLRMAPGPAARGACLAGHAPVAARPTTRCRLPLAARSWSAPAHKGV